MLKRKRFYLGTVLVVALLVACGGGGGGGGGTNTAGNQNTEPSTFPMADTCNYTNTSESDDLLITFAWHLRNLGNYFASFVPGSGEGVDLCMGSLWADGTVGTGVRVNVVDSGLEINHEDLAANVIAGASFNHLDNSDNPTNNVYTYGDHGTSVAGLIAAVKGNARGSAGVAPGAGLMGYNFLVSNQEPQDLQKAFGVDSNHMGRSGSADIFNFSAGHASYVLSEPNAVEDAFINNMTTLRANKGAVFVKSAGNGFDWFAGMQYGNCTIAGVTCQNVNQDTGNTAYNTMVVAAVGADGKKSSYSSTGSAIWVSGFGGEYGGDVTQDPSYPSDSFYYKPAMVTTDQSGCHQGYTRYGLSNMNLLDRGDGTGTGNPDCSYTAGFNGTSSAAPTVSGVVALVLEANPALTWRDVRHILARTARRTDVGFMPITTESNGQTFTFEQGWVTNAAGYRFHNWYGFGLVNAAAAVAMAKTYTAGSLGTFKAETKTADIGTTTITPSITGVSKTFAVNGAGGNPATVEQAELTLYVGSSFPPICSQIELTSPSGTKSILLNIFSAHTSTSVNGVRFLSNAFYGEQAKGTWTLRIINGCVNDNLFLSTTQGQQLTIRGR